MSVEVIVLVVTSVIVLLTVVIGPVIYSVVV